MERVAPRSSLVAVVLAGAVVLVGALALGGCSSSSDWPPPRNLASTEALSTYLDLGFVPLLLVDPQHAKREVYLQVGVVIEHHLVQG